MIPTIRLPYPLTRLKPYLRWVILGIALFFLFKTLIDHWQEVLSIKMTASSWAGLVVALGVTLFAHIWSGWVWHWILAELGISISGLWTTSVYLKTNIVKYLPGNVWHFYGRVKALKTAGANSNTAIIGVLLEPLLMVAGALTLAALGNWQLGGLWRLLTVIGLVGVLVGVHPRFLNPLVQKLAQAKAKAQRVPDLSTSVTLLRYPLKPYLGELGFVLLRSLGFLLAVVILQPVTGAQWLPVLGGFSLAWVLGLVIPGAPGGIGVFEAVAIATLQSQLVPGLLLSSVVFYRLISTLAEAIGAGLIWLDHPSRSTALPPSPPIRALISPGADELQTPGTPTPETIETEMALTENIDSETVLTEQNPTSEAVMLGDTSPDISTHPELPFPPSHDDPKSEEE